MKNQSKLRNIIIIISVACLVALTSLRFNTVEGQVLDKILNTNSNKGADEVISNNGKNLANERQQQPELPVVSRVRDMWRDMMTVNVPIFYDMVRNGSSMGINVLSGLVKVERGDEAERSGLVGNGLRKPLSVRVFGIPVYERGTRVQPLDSGVGSAGGSAGGSSAGRPSRPDETDELPL